MAKHRRGRPGQVCSFIGHHPRAFVSGLLLVAAISGLPGCIQQPGSTTGTIEIDLLAGETAGGNVFDGQRVRATALVEAGHIYNVSVVLGEVSAGSDAGVGVVSGAPLVEPVEFSVLSSLGGNLGGLDPGGAFVAHLDGEVTVEFVFRSADTVDPPDPLLAGLRSLVRGITRASYQILLTDLGFDDNGTSPEDAVVLSVGTTGELTGTLNPGEDADYFVLQVQADTAYELTLESTHSIAVASGSEDRFGQINFGAPTAGGLLINGSASAGTPGITGFTAVTTEEVLLRVAASGSDASSTATIQYAISVVETVSQEQDEQAIPQ